MLTKSQRYVGCDLPQYSQVAEFGRRTIRDFSAYRRGIQNEKYTGSNPVLTTLNKNNFLCIFNITSICL
jgi:hypothetical protein